MTGGIGDAGESKPPNNEKAGPAPGVWAHGLPPGDDGPEPYGRVPAINKGGRTGAGGPVRHGPGRRPERPKAPLGRRPRPGSQGKLPMGLQEQADVGIDIGIHEEGLEVGGPGPDAGGLFDAGGPAQDVDVRVVGVGGAGGLVNSFTSANCCNISSPLPPFRRRPESREALAGFRPSPG